MPSKFVKCANIIFIAEFDADLKSIEKVVKNHAKKVITEKVTEKESFLHLLLSAKVFGQ